MNRRPHPYQQENLTFSSRFSSIEPHSLHFNYYLPLFSHRFSAASTAVCGCLCGQKAFPLIDQSVGKLFSVCSLPLSESIGNLLRSFCNTQILRRHKERIELNAFFRNIQVSKEFSRFLVAQQTDTGASIFASMLGEHRRFFLSTLKVSG